MNKQMPLMRVPESLKARGRARDDAYGPLDTVMGKHLRGKNPESQEYLLGRFIGIGDAHTSMFPVLCEMLERAEKLDWNKDLVAPVDSAARCEVVNYGSFEAMYSKLIEPWLGKYDELKDTYDRFTRHEISRDEAERRVAKSRERANRANRINAEDVELQRLRDAPLGGAPKGNKNASKQKQPCIAQKEEIQGCIPAPTGTSSARALRVLRENHKEIHAKVLAGELTPNAGMVAAGRRKKQARPPKSPFKALAKKIGERGHLLTPKERAQLIRMLEEA
jgi:hypothetical protein